MRRSRLRASISLAVLWPLAAAALGSNIDPNGEGLQYAWGENVGWVNFQPNQGPGVTVTGEGLSGLAWGENIGWINLSPANGFGGVIQDGAGNLAGFAWAENAGWINFAPAGAGVWIDDEGIFHGWAWGENIGWIRFSQSASHPFGVRTAWRPPGQGPRFVRGDVNQDSSIDLADAIGTLKYIFANASVACLDAADVNEDDNVDIGDAVYLLAHLFVQGPPPAPPHPACGPDPTIDALGCASFPSCNE